MCLAFSFGLSSCKKLGGNQGDPIPEDIQEIPELLGTWEWIISEGPAGVPTECAGDSLQRQAVFEEDNNLYYFENSVETNHYQYYSSVEQGSIKLHFYYEETFLYNSWADLPHDDTLHLYDVETGREHFYSRTQ